MRYLTEIATWWDGKHKEAQASLDEFVERNPNQFSIVVATGVHTSMVLGAGIVDLLRLGDGIAERTRSGAAQDGLRLAGVVAPLGKGLQLLKSSANTKLARAIFDPCTRPICSWVGSTKALVQTGFKYDGKVFVAVDDLARAVGVEFKTIAGISLDSMSSKLLAIGAAVSEFKDVSSMREVVRMIPHDGSVVVISVKVMKQASVVGGHVIYAFYDTFGRLRFMDRSGIYSNVTELAQLYRATEFIPRTAFKLTNVYTKFVGPRGIATLAIEALGVISNEKN